MGCKPLLFCDVDGVLSLWGHLDGRPSPDTVFTNVDGILHALSRAALDRLAELSARYDVVWATGWEEKADEHLRAHMPLPRSPGWPHLELDAARGAGIGVHGHWKLASIAAAAGPHRPLAFVDDALDAACERWAAARSRTAPTLLVATDPATGLDAAAAARLHAFADGLDAVSSVTPTV